MMKRGADYSLLIGALRQARLLLENSHAQRILIAAMTMEEFKQQDMPSHCTLQQRTLIGPRVPSSALQRNASRAVWPNDGLTENSFPIWHIVIRGKADIRVMDYAVRCHPGDVIFTPAFVPRIDGSRPHYEEITPHAFCDVLAVRLSSDGATASLCHSQGARHEKSGAGEAGYLKHCLIKSLGEELARELLRAGSDKSTFALFGAMLLFMQHKIEQGECLASWQYPVIPSTSLQSDPVTQAQEYMKSHYYSPLTIDKVARWVGVSRTVFVRKFHQQTGTTFREHLTHLRMEAAKEHLRHSTLSVERISVSVGLTSNQLRNLFKRHYQCSPLEFRHNHRKD